jgi:zinc transport system substrate-binding protein
MTISPRSFARAGAALVAAAVLAGCGGTRPAAPSSEPGSPGLPSVVVGFFPIADAARVIGGDAVEVVNLTPAGLSPHELEVTPQQRGSIESAAAVLYLGQGFQPQVEQAVASLPAGVDTVDLLDVVDLLPVTRPPTGIQGEVDGEVVGGGRDPHAWVSPRLFSEMVERVIATLAMVAPEAAAAITERGADYRAELDALDAEFRAGLTGCASTALVTSHRAFEYLARDYGLTQVPIGGLSPEEEPDPRTLAAVAEVAHAQDVTTVFFEDALPPDLAETVAREIGAGADLLSPIETIGPEDLAAGASYVSIQRNNLDRLVKGLRCSGV